MMIMGPRTRQKKILEHHKPVWIKWQHFIVYVGRLWRINGMRHIVIDNNSAFAIWKLCARPHTLGYPDWPLATSSVTIGFHGCTCFGQMPFTYRSAMLHNTYPSTTESHCLVMVRCGISQTSAAGQLGTLVPWPTAWINRSAQ